MIIFYFNNYNQYDANIMDYNKDDQYIPAILG